MLHVPQPCLLGVIPEGGQGGRVRPALGRGAGIHGVRGASGGVRVRGPGLSPDFRPRAPPSPRLFTLRNHSSGGGGAAGMRRAGWNGGGLGAPPRPDESTSRAPAPSANPGAPYRRSLGCLGRRRGTQGGLGKKKRGRSEGCGAAWGRRGPLRGRCGPAVPRAIVLLCQNSVPPLRIPSPRFPPPARSRPLLHFSRRPAASSGARRTAGWSP